MIAPNGLRAVVRGGIGALAAIMLTSVVSALATSPADWRTATRVSTVQPGGVRLITGGQLTSQVTSTAPPGADLRALTVEKAGKGYSASVFFTGAFQQVDSYAGQPISHAVFISLRPAGGDELQVQLLPGGNGKIQRVQAGQLTDVGTAAPTIDGDHVTFPVPAYLSPKPDWEIQGHVIMLRPDGSGFHKHTKPGLIGALTGETGRIMSFPSSGIVIEKGRYLYWKHVDMPAEARAKSFRLEQKQGKLMGVLTLAAPFKPVSTINGKPVASQGAQFTFFANQDSTVGDVLLWDALAGRATAVDLRDPQNPKNLGETIPSIKGDEVVFDLSFIPLPSSLMSPTAARGFAGLLLDAAAQEPQLRFAEGATSLEDADGNGDLDPGFVDAVNQIGPQLGQVSTPTGSLPFTMIIGAFGVVIVLGGLVLLYSFFKRREGAKTIGSLPAISGTATAHEMKLVNESFAQADVASLPGTITPDPQRPPQIQVNVPGTPTIPPPVQWPGTSPPPLPSSQSSPAVAQETGSGQFDPLGIFSQIAEAESAPSQEPPQPTGPPVHDVTGVTGPLVLDVVGGELPPPPTGPQAPPGGQTSTNPPEADDGLEPPSRTEMPPTGASHVDDDGLEPPSRSEMPPIGAAGQGMNSAGTGVGTLPANLVPKTVAQQLADDCGEKKRKCAEARAAAKAANLKAYEASARAVNTARDCDAANKSLADAEAALRAAIGTPSTDRSWAELADGSRRITAPDIRLPNAASQGVWDQYRSGQITAQQAVDQWTKIGSPEGIEALKKASQEAAQPGIDQAKANVDRDRRWQQEICQKAAEAARAADAARKDADAANAKADAICAAAADCPE